MIESTLMALLSAICQQTYPLVVPAGKQAPFMTYSRVSTTRLRDLSGPHGVANPTFRVDVYAESFFAARQIANQVRGALDGHQDAEIMSVALVQEQDLSELTSNPALFRVNLEFEILHRE